MIPRSDDGKQRVLSLSYGKDSMDCLGALDLLGLPLDRIVTAEVWATDTIQADLPPMVEFKSTADEIIKARYGIAVEHFVAKKTCNIVSDKVTYEDVLYHRREKGKFIGSMYGFPIQRGNWCLKLKLNAIKEAQADGAISYVGIAEDEPERLKRLDGITKISPLHLIGWTEADAMKWCIENGLRSPIYDDANRGGCWFCHNQGTDQLRKLRRNYPELWALLLKWDSDSPVTFKADGHTVHDFDRRFQWEDEGFIHDGKQFRWADIEQPQMNFWQMEGL